jgi:hypothetical protein
MSTVKPEPQVQISFDVEDQASLTNEQKLKMVDEDLAEFNNWLVSKLKTHPMLAVERQMLKTYLCRKAGITR